MNTGERIAYWMMWFVTALVGCFVLAEGIATFATRHVGFLDLPPISKEHNEYKKPERQTNNEEIIPASSRLVDNGNNASTEPTQAQKNQEWNDILRSFFKEKRDLNAQEGMWRSANYLVIVTLVQLFVGSFTLALLGWTLWTQRSELGAALRGAKASENAARAHVYVDFEVSCKRTDRDLLPTEIKVPVVFSITPILINYGNTPAETVSYEITGKINAKSTKKKGLNIPDSQSWDRTEKATLHVIPKGKSNLPSSYIYHDRINLKSVYHGRYEKHFANLIFIGSSEICSIHLLLAARGLLLTLICERGELSVILLSPVVDLLGMPAIESTILNELLLALR